MDNNGMYQGYTVEGMAELKLKPETLQEQPHLGCNYNIQQPMPYMMPPTMCQPIYECPRERVVHRQILHEVPHVCPFM